MWLLIRLVLMLVFIAGSAPASCYNREHVSAFLEFKHGLKLHSWGLNDKGEMEELFLSGAGHWAVLVTKPNRCSDIISFPHKERGRLVEKKSPNKFLPPDRLLSDGVPM